MPSFFERIQQRQQQTHIADTTPTSDAEVTLQKRAPELVDLHKQAGVSLAKHHLTGVRAAVYLVLDHSGSMGQFYRDGTVQDFTEKVLAAAVHFDDDGSIPVVLFDTYARRPQDVTIDDYKGAVERMHQDAGHMGTTDYVAAMDAVIDHYQQSGATEPALVIFETDGAPNNRRAAEKKLCQAAGLPIFWQFVGFGGDNNHPEFEFLRKLDELSVPKHRVVDNAGFFAAGTSPKTFPTDRLYDNLMGEFPSWLSAARAQNIIR